MSQRTVNEWIIEQLEKYDGDIESVKSLYSKFKKESGSKSSRESYYRRIRESYDNWVISKVEEKEGCDLNPDDYVKIAAQKQKLQDKNRVANKHSREINRVYNYFEDLVDEYHSLIESIDLSKIKIKKPLKKGTAKYGIVHLSDLHLNERISYSEGIDNEYSFTIASKRLKKFITEAKEQFKVKGINTVLIAVTGDLINSPRRLSESLSKITALSRASLLATQLLSQVIIDLGEDFNIIFGSVCGNESRLSEEWETTDHLLAENWDYLISENLRLMFKDNKNITFLENNNYKELVFSLGNFNGILNHGDSFPKNNLEKGIKEYIGKFAMRGTPIHGVFFGHIHSSYIADTFARSSSLCGANPYSSNTLNLISRASQNIYIINEDERSFSGYKIDLQNTEGYEGYDINDELKRYNVHEPEPNTQVVIRNYRA